MARFLDLSGVRPLSNEGLADFAQNLQKGMQAGAMPEQLRRQAEKERLANALMQIQQKYLPQTYESQIGLQGAQADLARQKAETEKIFGGLNRFSGQPGQIQGLEYLRQQFGENSDQYQMAKRAIEADIKHKEAMGSIAGLRYLTPGSRKNVEQIYLESGRLPPGVDLDLDFGELPENAGEIENKLIDPKIARWIDDFERDRIKAGTDASTRTSIIRGKNLEPIIEKIDPEKAFVYSGGLGGMINFKADQALAYLDPDNAPQRYKDYLSQKKLLEMLAKQYRQFLGDSVTPGAQEALNGLFDAADPSVPKETAIKIYQNAIEVLNNELSNMYGVAESPSGYKKPTQQAGNTIKVRNKKTGEEKTMSEEEARKMGIIQ